MARTTQGIRPRHSRTCNVAHGGKCNCTPSYEAFVPVKLVPPVPGPVESGPRGPSIADLAGRVEMSQRWDQHFRAATRTETVELRRDAGI